MLDDLQSMPYAPGVKQHRVVYTFLPSEHGLACVEIVLPWSPVCLSAFLEVVEDLVALGVLRHAVFFAY